MTFCLISPNLLYWLNWILYWVSLSKLNLQFETFYSLAQIAVSCHSEKQHTVYFVNLLGFLIQNAYVYSEVCTYVYTLCRHEFKYGFLRSYFMPAILLPLQSVSLSPVMFIPYNLQSQIENLYVIQRCNQVSIPERLKYALIRSFDFKHLNT